MNSVLESRKPITAAVLGYATVLRQELGEAVNDVLRKERTWNFGTSPVPLMFPGCTCE